MSVVKNQKNQVKMHLVEVKSNHPAFVDIDALFKDLTIDTWGFFSSPVPSFFSIREKRMTIFEHYYIEPFGYRNQWQIDIYLPLFYFFSLYESIWGFCFFFLLTFELKQLRATAVLQLLIFSYYLLLEKTCFGFQFAPTLPTQLQNPHALLVLLPQNAWTW